MSTEKKKKNVDLTVVCDDDVKSFVCSLVNKGKSEQTPNGKITNTPPSTPELTSKTRNCHVELISVETSTPQSRKRQFASRNEKSKRKRPEKDDVKVRNTSQTPKQSEQSSAPSTPVSSRRTRSTNLKDVASSELKRERLRNKRSEMGVNVKITEVENIVNPRPRREGLRDRRSEIGVNSKITEPQRKSASNSAKNTPKTDLKIHNFIKKTDRFQRKTPKADEKDENTPRSTRSMKVNAYSSCATKSTKVNGTMTEYDSSSSEVSSDSGSEEYTPSEDSSDSDSEVVSTSDDNKSERQERTPKSERLRTSRFNLSARRRILEVDYDVHNVDLDEYFVNKKTPTGKKTMREFKSFSFKPKEFGKLLEENNVRHEKEIAELYALYVSKFEAWLAYLSQGFNLLLYGLGSKVELIEEFRSQMLADYHVLCVKGFMPPKVILKQIFHSLVKDLLGETRCPVNGEEALIKVKNLLKWKKFPVFLIIHNMDAPGLRLMKTQAMLSELSMLPNIHLIVTMDHINAPVLFGNRTLGRFNFISQAIHTYQSYTSETRATGGFEMQVRATDNLSSLKKIICTSIDKVKKIFKIIIEHHLEHNRDKKYHGMPIDDLFDRAKTAMLITKISELDDKLRGLYDHEVLKKTNERLLFIPISINTLTQFYQEYFGCKQR